MNLHRITSIFPTTTTGCDPPLLSRPPSKHALLLKQNRTPIARKLARNPHFFNELPHLWTSSAPIADNPFTSSYDLIKHLEVKKNKRKIRHPAVYFPSRTRFFSLPISLANRYQ